jgi:lysyl-tRNA synthetase class 2
VTDLPWTLRDRLERRHRALAALRRTLCDQGFVEADTWQLVRGPGLEPHLDPLRVPVRHDLHGAPHDRYLITSPELALKQVVAAGVPRVFQLGHVFRDGERTVRHTPEFTLLEWYRGPGTLAQIEDDTLALVRAVADAIGNASGVDVHAPPERLTVAEAFSRFAGIDLGTALDAMHAGDADALPRAVRATGEVLRPGADFEDAFFQVMGQHVEPHIGLQRLTILSGWPREMAVLARLDGDDPRYARRFEAYVGGLELCNAFDELRDPVEQRVRFEADNATRVALGKERLPLDEDFLTALPGLPEPTAGNALGVDRLLMLLTGSVHIDDVQLLPWR